MGALASAPVLRALYARGHKGIELGLDRVREAARALGNPQDAFQALHVAGTNGKGSTSAMLERVVRDKGWRTGLYTSPHLSQLSERVRVQGEQIADEALLAALERVLADASDQLTFFETLTLAAFVAFREARVEVAVLEVGLGGRLDATNLVRQPLACGVVSISQGDQGRHLEHEALLGTTVAAIAREKAGIFKRGCPAVLGPLAVEARSAVLDVAREREASPIWSVGEPLADADVCTVSLRKRETRAHATLPGELTVNLAPALPGAHQIDNAAVAAAMAAVASSALGLDAGHIERGIALASWPGRFEPIRARDRSWVLDCAHNIDGVRALVLAARAAELTPERTILLFGALSDKPFAQCLALLAPLARRRVYASPSGRAPAPLEALAAVAPGLCVPAPEQAVTSAIELAGPHDTILVTGSIYLVGAIRAHLLGIEPDPVIAL